MIDTGFPDHQGQNQTSETVERVFHKSNLEIAEMIGCLDIPIRVTGSQTRFQYRLQHMAHGQELFRTAPDLKLQDAFTRPWLPVLLHLMHSRCALLFDEYLKLGTNAVS
jgi:hypothetical protein